MSIGRHRNRRFVPAVVGITGLALGRTVAPIGLAAVRTVCGSTVATVVGISAFAFAGTVGPVFGTAVRRRYGRAVAAVVGIGFLADRRAGGSIIFFTAVTSRTYTRRAGAAGIFAPARSARYRARRGTVGRVVYIFAFADAGLIFSAAAGSLSDLI